MKRRKEEGGEKRERRSVKKKEGKEMEEMVSLRPSNRRDIPLSAVPLLSFLFCARIASKMRRGVAKPWWKPREADAGHDCREHQ